MIKKKYMLIILATVILGFSIKSIATIVKEMNSLKLHIDSVVVDTHNDTMMRIIDDTTWLPKIDIRNETENQIDIPKMRAGNLRVAFFAAYSTAYYGNPQKSISRTLALINALYWTEKNNSDIFNITSTFDEIEKAVLDWKIAAVPSIEGAYSLDNNNAIELVRQYYDLGIKAIGFTWNYSNALGEGGYKAFADATGTRSPEGLTKLGEEVIKEMNKLGMIIDVSHLSEDSFWDVIKATEAPIIASHSGVYNIKNHVRNLNDKQLKALAENGGVIGVVLYPDFLGDPDNVYIKDYVDHIDYIVKLIGIDHVGIGSDFDGASMPKDMKDSSELYKITEELVKRGYKDEDIKKILGKNTLRVIKEVEKLAEDINAAEGINIIPSYEMGQITTESKPLLTAKVELVHGPDLDEGSFRVVVDGIEYKPKYNKETALISLQVSSELIERFHVVTFEATNKAGQVQRETRIFYID